MQHGFTVKESNSVCSKLQRKICSSSSGSPGDVYEQRFEKTHTFHSRVQVGDSCFSLGRKELEREEANVRLLSYKSDPIHNMYLTYQCKFVDNLHVVCILPYSGSFFPMMTHHHVSHDDTTGFSCQLENVQPYCKNQLLSQSAHQMLLLAPSSLQMYSR